MRARCGISKYATYILMACNLVVYWRTLQVQIHTGQSFVTRFPTLPTRQGILLMASESTHVETLEYLKAHSDEIASRVSEYSYLIADSLFLVALGKNRDTHIS